MKRISIVTAIVFLSLYTFSCTPEVLSEDEYIEYQATEGDDEDVTPVDPDPDPDPLPPKIEG